MADRYRGTIYVGVTADIAARAMQHREGKAGSFTHRYGLTRLVYLEGYDDITDAIAREKAVKKWNRAWKPTRGPAHKSVIARSRRRRGNP